MTEGVLPVDKPAGPTSHDVVNAARRALGTRRIGHTGTLDPFASGLLLLCAGSATRIAEYVTAERKRYTATLVLGVATNTDDCTGEVVGGGDASGVTDQDVERALAAQRGRVLQVPPAYSAKKKEGRRAYALARAGAAVELDPVPVTIHELNVVRRDGDVVQLDVTCSSGTYIRAIARDVGALLGTGAHLSALRRTAVGVHDVRDAVPLDALDAATAAAAMISAADAMSGYPRMALDSDAVRHVQHGRAVPTSLDDAEVVALLADGRLAAVARVSGGMAHPRKVLL